MGGSTVVRGGEFLATFICASAVNTTTNIDKLVYPSASGTVAIANTLTQHAIGHLRELGSGGSQNENCVVSLFAPTKKGIAGAAINTVGGLLVHQTGTMYFITAAGTLTANPVVGIPLTTAGVSGERFEYMPLYYSTVVLA